MALIQEDFQVLTPAFNRDYKSKKEVTKDFLEGKDFRLNSLFFGFTLCSIRDFAPGVRVNLRYNSLRQVTIVEVPS